MVDIGDLSLDDAVYGRSCRNGHLLGHAAHKEPSTIEGPDFCPHCGAETIVFCPNCEEEPLTLSEIHVTAMDYSSSDLEDYCRNCGEPLPWVNPVEKEEIRDAEFINVETPSGRFYIDLVHEINLCYRVGANEATLVMYRKLLENLLKDVLAGEYEPDEGLELYYNPDKGQHHPLSVLIQNFEDNLGDFHHYSNALDDGFINEIKQFKRQGDASAHTIERNISDEEIEDRSDEATYVANVLFDLRIHIYQHN